MRRLSLTLLSLLVALGLFAQRGTCGNGISWKLTDGTLTISGNGEMNDFSSSQRPSWDVYKDDITKVIIETGVTNVGGYAFENYTNLRQVELAEGIEIIGSTAFSGCEGIGQLTLPQSIRKIGSDAFYGLGISALIIPEGLETISTAAFGNCKSLATVNWNATNCSCTGKWGGPFYNTLDSSPCHIEEVIFGKNVHRVPNTLFYSCGSLKTVRTSGSISVVDYNAFYQTQWLNNQPEGIIYIDKALYTYNGVMTKATTINIPEGVESITGMAFWNCKYLVGITLPATLKSIGDGTFRGCTALGRIEWNAGNCGDFTSTTPPFSETAVYEVVFGNQVKHIPDYTFYKCTGLEEVSLPASVISIGEAAFRDCDALTHVNLGESLDDIGQHAFRSCNQLGSINFPSHLSTIDAHAFKDCPELKSITLPEGLTFLGESAFANNKNLKQVTFNSINCTTGYSKARGMGPYSPFDSSPLETFTIGDKVTRIPYGICRYQNLLKEISIPNSVKIIEDGAFKSCSGIASLTIGENVETLEERAFSGCSDGVKVLVWNAVRTNSPESPSKRLIPSQAIEKLTLGEKVEMIPDYLCYNCKQLEDLTIPASVKTIGRQAFANTGLTEVFLPAGVTEIGSGAFGSNKQLKRVVVASNEAAQAASPFSGNAPESIMVPDVAAYSKAQGWSNYSSLLKPMVSLSRDRFVYSGKLPETEAVNNLTGYTLRLGALELDKDAGTYTARAEASYTGPHAFTVSVPFAYQIAKAPLALTPADVKKVYGDRNPATYGYTQEGLVNGETLEEAFDLLPVFSTDTDDRVQAGAYAIRLANSPEAKNYAVTCREGLMTVTPKPLHVAAVSTSRPYGEDNPELELAYEGFAFEDDARSLSAAPQASCEAGKWSDTGEYEIRVSGGESRNYTFSYASGVLSVTAARQEIVWDQELPELHVGDSIALDASASSGLPVTFITSTPETCRITLAEGRYFLVCLAEGTARVQAAQAGNGNWQAAENAERELTVEAATGIAGHEAARLSVCTDHRQIVVKGAAKGATISLHALNGTLLHREACRGNELRLAVKQAGIYVVSVGDQSFRVTVE